VNQGADGFLTVGSKGFEALTVEALRELRAEQDVRIEALQEGNEALHRENDALRARLERIEARLRDTDRR
jgi:regulator of replication initiation timing